MSSTSHDKAIQFGSRIRSQHFLFDPSYTPLNHGSYGTFPIAVREYQRTLQDRIEARSDPYIRFTIPDLLTKSRAAAALLLGAPTDDVVFVPNATTAVNTVLRNLKFVQGDTIVYFSTAYGACEKTIKYICQTTPAQYKCINVTFPMDDEVLEKTFHDTIIDLGQEGRVARIAMFDTVATFPGVRLPWEALVKTCKKLGVKSLIDGAHGIGHIDLSHLADVGPDFFTSNCYKWLYTPRACAVYYVPRRNQHLMVSSLPTSHGFEEAAKDDIDGMSGVDQTQGRFADQFKWLATVDQTPYLCVPEAIKFRTEVCGGEDEIRNYCFRLAREGGQAIVNMLGTETMENLQGTLGNCCFTNIRLPLDFQSTDTGNDVASNGFDPVDGPDVVKWLMNRAMCEFDTWIPGKFYGGAAWVRLSAQIYLEMKDFEWAGTVLRKLCDRIAHGEWRQSRDATPEVR